MSASLRPARMFRYRVTMPATRYNVRLSDPGKAAEQEHDAVVAESDILDKAAGDAQSRAARRLLCHEWQPNSKVAKGIEAAVAER